MDLTGARYFRSEWFTHYDKKTGQIDRQIETQIWVFPDWSYQLVFNQIV